MASTKQIAQPLQPPNQEIADRGIVRLGSGSITASIPPLRRPSLDVADRGTVRLGSGSITASFPFHR
jgi:hypothetical protein